MSYNLLKPVRILNLVDMSSDITSVAIEVRNQDNIGVQLHWTGSPVGTFGLEVSSDHLQDLEGNIQVPGNWVALPLDPVIRASGSADDAFMDLNQLPAQYVRITYNATSGTGSVSGVIVAKGV